MLNKTIAWFASNSVAANLLLVAVVVGGLVTLPSVVLEAFPEVTVGLVNVSVEYPGAAPEEVEEGILLVRIEEEALRAVDGVKKPDSLGVARRALGVVSVELTADARRWTIASLAMTIKSADRSPSTPSLTKPRSR